MKPCSFKFKYIIDTPNNYAEELMQEIDYEEPYAEHLVNTLIKEKANKLSGGHTNGRK